MVAVAAVGALTAVHYPGVQKSALLTRAIVALVLGVLTAVVIASPHVQLVDTTHPDIGTDAAAPLPESMQT
ncbi:hypothetical protein GCM10010503_36750 [Streptomyces lucensis JCM 4490]|uniref:Uncharacterized protein n=1 Tax=Streptomyces lucensis JCM 4490 TaxID=1306176 RepID=A0A918J9U9_9ACTN|nr:hypothetical protein GCM10010503_36750 [Streptomyces lucensis JCM 4490]